MAVDAARSLRGSWAGAGAVNETAHDRAIETALRWLEEEVTEVRWSSGRERAKPPGWSSRPSTTSRTETSAPSAHALHDPEPGPAAERFLYALDTRRLLRNVVAAGTLYTLAMTTEVCEKLGPATVPREVTPGLRPVMKVAGVDQDLIVWSSTGRS
ncbi:relaxase domain-containing protein [Streptomyces sp. NPDC012769]|uniref:relaxase domain-containing protein n=1 Tax=Streptomyces sp. NPDC012769 TaxID=3364848 RepID=UPI0036749B5F